MDMEVDTCFLTKHNFCYNHGSISTMQDDHFSLIINIATKFCEYSSEARGMLRTQELHKTKGRDC